MVFKKDKHVIHPQKVVPGPDKVKAKKGKEQHRKGGGAENHVQTSRTKENARGRLRSLVLKGVRVVNRDELRKRRERE